MRDFYILNDQGEPFALPAKTERQRGESLIRWANWMEHARDLRIVKQEWVGNVKVSTVFLGLDHNFLNEGPPIYWETMTFSNRKDFCHDCWRCAGSREQAIAQHERICAEVRVKLSNAKSSHKKRPRHPLG